MAGYRHRVGAERTIDSHLQNRAHRGGGGVRLAECTLHPLVPRSSHIADADVFAGTGYFIATAGIRTYIGPPEYSICYFCPLF